MRMDSAGFVMSAAVNEDTGQDTESIRLAITEATHNIIRFARNTKHSFTYLNNPSLTLVFPDLKALEPYIRGSQTEDLDFNWLIQQISGLFRAYVSPEAEEQPKDYQLVCFTGEASWLSSDGFIEITDKLRFFLATQGAIQYYYKSEYEEANKLIVDVAKRLASPDEFRERMTVREWPTSGSLWSAWMRFKLNNDQKITELTKVVLQTVLRLETLRIVKEYLELEEIPEDTTGLPDQLVEMAVNQRKVTANAIREASEILRRSKSLLAVRDAIACFAALHMLSLHQPPISDDIQYFVDQILLLIQRLESDIIIPSLEILGEQSKLEDDVIAFAHSLPKIRAERAQADAAAAS